MDGKVDVCSLLTKRSMLSCWSEGNRNLSIGDAYWTFREIDKLLTGIPDRGHQLMAQVRMVLLEISFLLHIEI